MPARAAGRGIYGTHTCCFEIIHGEKRLIIDAGTGICDLGEILAAPGDTPVDILFTHCHWDHIIGLTGFRPLFEPGRSIHLYFGHLAGGAANAVMEGLFHPPCFPISLAALPARPVFRNFSSGERLSLAGLAINTIRLNHPDGAVGYRFDSPHGAIAVITDHEHGNRAIDEALEAFCAEVDLLVYDAMWDEDVDYQPHRGWGHSTWQAGLALLRRAGAKRLLCLHHDPHSDDEKLAAREKKLQAEHELSLFVREGLSVSLG